MPESPEQTLQVEPGGRNMPWVCERVKPGCLWCGGYIMTISDRLRGPDLCRSCAKIRSSRKKAGDDICRGGCGVKLQWNVLRCNDCYNANRWSSGPPGGQGTGSTRKPRGKGLKEAKLYYQQQGQGVPWEDKPEAGTWG